MTLPAAPPVDCRRGAPMGRASASVLATTAPIHVSYINVVDGYDDGGAYWGRGAPLWGARDGNAAVAYLRAPSRGIAETLFRRMTDNPQAATFARAINPTAYLRREPATGPILPTSVRNRGLRKHMDVCAYRDVTAVDRIARWPWHYTGKPRLNCRRVRIDCVGWNVVWLPDLEAEAAE